MSTYLITYDLRAPGRNYDDLYIRIKAYGTYSSPLESVWLIETSETASEIREYLKGVMDDGDGLFVVEIAGRWAYSNIKSSKEWIDKRLH